VVKSEAPSLGWLPVPHSRHSTVELAIGTCRHHLPMVASGGHPCQRQSASTRSHSGRWFDIRRYAILGVATGIPHIPLWLERRPPPIPLPVAASARFGMVGSSISGAALFYGLAIGTSSPSGADGQSGRTQSRKIGASTRRWFVGLCRVILRAWLYHHPREAIMKKHILLAIIVGTAVIATPVSFNWPSENHAAVVTLNSADARVGQPLSAGSVAGVHRRAARRAYRRGY